MNDRRGNESGGDAIGHKDTLHQHLLLQKLQVMLRPVRPRVTRSALCTLG